MVFNKIITFCILCAVFVDFIDSIPTYGDEFVHIRVNLPKYPSSSRGIMGAKQESGSLQLHHTGHNVIHHFHRRRRPTKKVSNIKVGPLMENVLLAELDKRSTEHYYQHEARNTVLPPIGETYEVGEEAAVTKVNTYKVIEEMSTKPNYKDYEKSHHDYDKGNIETYKIIEEHKTQKHHQPKHVDQHVDLVKLLEKKPYYPYQQHIANDEHINYQYHTPQEESSRIIKNFKYITSYEPHQKEVEEEEEEYEEKGEGEQYFYPQHHMDQDYSDYYKPQYQEPLEILKTQFSNAKDRPYQESPYAQEYIEILKTETDYEAKNHYDHHQPQKEIVQIKETKYSKPREEYYYQQEGDHNSQSPRKSHNLGNVENYETGYHYHKPSTSLHQSSYETQGQYYKPSGSVERKFKFKPLRKLI